jgi:sulfatase modifying factor 1
VVTEPRIQASQGGSKVTYSNRRIFVPRRVTGLVSAMLGATIVGFLPARAIGEVPSMPSSAASPEAPIPVEQVCKVPGPKPAAPKCARYATSRVVRGGKAQVVQEPVASCIDDPGWEALDAWEAASTEARSCVKDFCSGQGNLVGTSATCFFGAPARIACSPTKVRALDCSKLPPAREGTGRMALLPRGTFALAETNERLTVEPFALDLTEVTVDAYAKCVSAAACSPPSMEGDRCNWGVTTRGEHPMNCVDWHQANGYCQWAGKRLPTEAEWEWAARGQSRGAEYPWGSDAPDMRGCWTESTLTFESTNRQCAGEHFSQPFSYGSNQLFVKRMSTCKVGVFPLGDAPGGIHDLAGNVWEWTSTPFDDSSHVTRGGTSFQDDPAEIRVGVRGHEDSSTQHDGGLGFRCAR